MKRCSLLLFALTLLASSSAQAARIYNIIDYPDLQSGHSLNGTITTTDDAPDDGMLQEEEVLDWHWEISGPNNISADWVEENSVFIDNIRITEDQILFRLDSISIMRLITPQLNPTVSLQWITIESSPYHSFFQAGFGGRDALIPYWTGNISSVKEIEWTIATAIPEPSAILVGILSIAQFVISRRWLRYLKMVLE